MYKKHSQVIKMRLKNLEGFMRFNPAVVTSLFVPFVSVKNRYLEVVLSDSG